MTVKPGQARIIDLRSLIESSTEKINNFTLSEINESLVSLGVFEGEMRLHRHETEDEFFFVLEGRLCLDLEGGKTVELFPLQGYTVPAGAAHRSRAAERVVVLRVERKGASRTEV